MPGAGAVFKHSFHAAFGPAEAGARTSQQHQYYLSHDSSSHRRAYIRYTLLSSINTQEFQLHSSHITLPPSLSSLASRRAYLRLRRLSGLSGTVLFYG